MTLSAIFKHAFFFTIACNFNLFLKANNHSQKGTTITPSHTIEGESNFLTEEELIAQRQPELESQAKKLLEKIGLVEGDKFRIKIQSVHNKGLGLKTKTINGVETQVLDDEFQPNITLRLMNKYSERSGGAGIQFAQLDVEDTVCLPGQTCNFSNENGESPEFVVSYDDLLEKAISGLKHPPIGYEGPKFPIDFEISLDVELDNRSQGSEINLSKIGLGAPTTIPMNDYSDLVNINANVEKVREGQSIDD